MIRLAAVAAAALGAAIMIVPTAAGAASDHVVNISTHCNVFCFAPEAITVAAGDTVTWVNNTPAEHIVARCTAAACNGHAGGDGADPAFTSAQLTMAAGARSHFTFSQPGTYVYYCTLHGYALMHGTITVIPAATTTTFATTTTTTTAAAAPTAAATTPPAPTLAAQPQLANTGNHTTGATVLALILIISGLAATAARRRRYS